MFSQVNADAVFPQLYDGGTMKIRLILAALVASMIAGGCRSTKSRATTELQKNWAGTAWCQAQDSFKSPEQPESYRVFTLEKECYDSVLASSVIVGKCLDSSPSKCRTFAMTPIKPARVQREVFEFPCGKTMLGQVVSTTTEGRSVTVKYTYSTTLDDAIQTAAERCSFRLPNPGKTEGVSVFKIDDDGNWTLR
ncbi:MAG: hypothetical protein MUF64_28800 [Polyangiaceae bacterium]|jgi:hypothetical protein|nr:hypothetical protein [Polyangiaceae bacterium]